VARLVFIGNKILKGFIMLHKGSFATLACVLTLGAVGKISAQNFTLPNGTFTYGNCAEVKASSFTPVTLVNTAKAPGLTEPVKFAVAKDGRVFFGERNGSVRVVSTAGVVTKLGDVPVWPITSKLKVTGSNELGLSGLTLDPDFETNNWIYITYQPTSPDVSKIVRYKVNGTTLDLASEQVLMEFPLQKNYCCHTGGDLKFDSKGDLWISVGNNTRNPEGTEISSPIAYIDSTSPDKDDQGHAANTNDYRGKILRIHPTATAGANGKFYTVPAGNLKDVNPAGWTDAEKAKVLPEIYTMGHRSNYTISIDSEKGWLTWGDIGPDEGRATEEFNLTAKPGFFGWPYFAGTKTGRSGADTYAFRGVKDEAAPKNTSPNNTGTEKLPPAIPATFGYLKSAAITGPIYRYNAAQTSAKKLPPHFDGKWFITDFNAGSIQVITLDAAGAVTARTGLINGLTRPLQLSIGPDGMLYSLEYGVNYFATDGLTAIKRWEYNGAACQSVGIAEKAAAKAALATGSLINLGLDAERFVSMPEAARGFRLYDLHGKLAFESSEGSASLSAKRVALPATLGNGVYRVKFQF
jgi:cytochrome c